jgi:hypothetical protein
VAAAGGRYLTLIVACIPGWMVHSKTNLPGAANVTLALAGSGVAGAVSSAPVLRKPLPWFVPVNGEARDRWEGRSAG